MLCCWISAAIEFQWLGFFCFVAFLVTFREVNGFNTTGQWSDAASVIFSIVLSAFAIRVSPKGTMDTFSDFSGSLKPIQLLLTRTWSSPTGFLQPISVIKLYESAWVKRTVFALAQKIWEFSVFLQFGEASRNAEVNGILSLTSAWRKRTFTERVRGLLGSLSSTRTEVVFPFSISCH